MPLESDTRDELIGAVRRFVREKLVPAERIVAETDEIPEEIVQGMRDLGLFGLTVPEAYGGLGLNTVEEVQVAFELGWASPA